MTQAELAQRLGVVQSRVADIERDPGAVSVEQLLQVLAMLGAQMVVRDNAGDVESAHGAELNARSTASATLAVGPKPLKSTKQGGANLGTTDSPKGPPDDEPRGQW